MASRERIRVIMAGGGTGGHLYPGLALAEEMRDRWGAEILFIGTNYGVEAKVLPATDYTFKRIWMRGLRRKLTPGNLLFPVRLLVSIGQSLWIMRRTRPHLVVGTGGYVSGPALIAARLLRVPAAIQEQNSYPGLVNRLLGKWVDQVHLTYESSKAYFKNPENLYVSGNPVRVQPGAVGQAAARRAFDLDESGFTLLVFGGSQGAHALNDVLVAALQDLLRAPHLQILWATGTADFRGLQTRIKEFSQRVHVRPYIEDMPAAYAAADLVLCRAGASTLAEITACGLPAILVPYPHAAANHQTFNARVLEAEGAARVILERDLTPERLTETVLGLLRQPEERTAMRAAARRIARPDAARIIVDHLEALLPATHEPTATNVDGRGRS